MTLLPPPLRWVESFLESIGQAIGSGVEVEIEKTVNPLVFNIKVTFGELIAGPRMMHIWNIFQQYASKNDTLPQGKVSISPRTMAIQVVVKRRLGPPRNEKP